MNNLHQCGGSGGNLTPRLFLWFRTFSSWMPRWKTPYFLYTWVTYGASPWNQCTKTRTAGEGNGNPLQYSCLEKSMDRGVWQAEGLHDWARVHEGGGIWVGSNKLVKLKKKKKNQDCLPLLPPWGKKKNPTWTHSQKVSFRINLTVKTIPSLSWAKKCLALHSTCILIDLIKIAFD